MKSTNKHRRIKTAPSKQVADTPVIKRNLVSDRTKKLAIVYLSFLLILAFLVEPSDLQAIALLALGSIVISS
jgi:hypothetical protein